MVATTGSSVSETFSCCLTANERRRPENQDDCRSRIVCCIANLLRSTRWTREPRVRSVDRRCPCRALWSREIDVSLASRAYRSPFANERVDPDNNPEKIRCSTDRHASRCVTRERRADREVSNSPRSVRSEDRVLVLREAERKHHRPKSYQ